MMALDFLTGASALSGILGGSSARRRQKQLMDAQIRNENLTAQWRQQYGSPALQALQGIANNPAKDPRYRIDQRNTENDVNQYYQSALPQIAQQNSMKGLNMSSFGQNALQGAAYRGAGALASSRTAQLGQQQQARIGALQSLLGAVNNQPNYMGMASAYGDQADNSLQGLSSLFGALGMERGEGQDVSREPWVISNAPDGTEPELDDASPGGISQGNINNSLRVQRERSPFNLATLMQLFGMRQR